MDRSWAGRAGAPRFTGLDCAGPGCADRGCAAGAGGAALDAPAGPRPASRWEVGRDAVSLIAGSGGAAGTRVLALSAPACAWLLDR